MHKLIVETYWLAMASYLRVSKTKVEAIVVNAYNDISNNSTYHDYSDIVLEAVKSYQRNKEALQL